MKKLPAALAVLALAGCAAQPLTITYDSNPPGARFVENGRFWGYTPFPLTYRVGRTPADLNRCIFLAPASVRWASGAEASISRLEACPKYGLSQQFVFERPADVPGLEFDQQFALQLQQTAALETIAAAQERAALFGALAQQAAAATQRSKPITCSSQAVNGVVQTICR